MRPPSRGQARPTAKQRDNALQTAVGRGPLGSLIVAETFIGLLQGDPESVLARDPSWRLGDPVQNLVLPGADKGFTFADLVAVGAGGRTKEKLSPVDDPANLPPAAANEPQGRPVAAAQ